jgi:hypothetical protein
LTLGDLFLGPYQQGPKAAVLLATLHETTSHALLVNEYGDFFDSFEIVRAASLTKPTSKIRSNRA